MFKRSGKASLMSRLSDVVTTPYRGANFFESLENRQLMSAAHGGAFAGGPRGGAVDEIAFSLAPTAVQSGLTSLATADGVTAPTATTEVYLGNRNGVETFSIRESSSGTKTTLTVDETGAAVTAPTRTNTTFGEVTNIAVTTEFAAIATALGLTAPASANKVAVTTAADGSAIYSLKLSGTASGSTRTRSPIFSVDSAGNVVGQARVPLSVLSTAVQNGLTSHTPSGATALTASSLIDVRTDSGVTLYVATYKSTGTVTRVSVDTTGALHSGTTTSSTTYADLTSSVASEIASLATAEGVTTTIDSTTKVLVTTQADGTVLYTIRLTATSSSGASYPITITVDAAGNPTTLGGGIGGPPAGASGNHGKPGGNSGGPGNEPSDRGGTSRPGGEGGGSNSAGGRGSSRNGGSTSSGGTGTLGRGGRR